jgi:putative tricarboxylic transport membrane protein
MVIFGIIYFFLFKLKYPVAPFVLGVILGPMIDENLRRAFWVHGGLMPVLTRPLALVLFIALLIMVASQISWVRNFIRKKVFIR